MAKLRTTLKLSQNLRMSQKLQQAIKLLQMNSQELSVEIRKELLENPVLEEFLETKENDVAEGEKVGLNSSEDLESTPSMDPTF